MKKTLLCLIPLSFAVAAHADEGMWQPAQLPSISAQLKEKGLELDPAGLTDLTEYPMGAVISLGNCTASFVSPQGLVVTNHHCAYGAIQYNSTPERNLIHEGFLAKTLAEELPGDPNARVYVTEAIRDVTKEVTSRLNPKMDGLARYKAIDAAEKALVAQCEKTPNQRCNVVAFYGGRSFQLIKQLEIKDVRLVYAPAGGIGNFGGEVDNWMWPRHTGDFSFLRAYVAPDGSSAPYAKENIPYKPKHVLKLDPRGLEPGDFTMIVGYPGHTNRYATANTLDNFIRWHHPLAIRYLNDLIGIMDQAGKEEARLEVLYASTKRNLENVVKKFTGELEGFSRFDPVGDKQREEQTLIDWLKQQGKAGETGLKSVSDYHALLARVRATRERDLLFAWLRTGLFSGAQDLYRLSLEREKPDTHREPGFQKRDEIRIEGRMKQLERRADPKVEQRLLTWWLEKYVDLPGTQHLAELDQWLGLDKNPKLSKEDIVSKVAALYAGSRFNNTEERLRWFNASRKAIEASDDALLKLHVQLMPAWLRLENENKQRQGETYQLRPRYMEAMIAYRNAQGRPIYPDANSTLRITYGSVKGYQPRDAVAYAAQTTLAGVLEKATGKDPFEAPAAQIAAIKSKDFGSYISSKLGKVPVNFLTDLDITGGNSGSPTLNAKGELVGLAFDGAWEGVASDWVFNPVLNRTIHVDVRYMLWVMDKVDHADNLLQEMGLR